MKLICKCGREIIWNDNPKYNSTIKPKPPEECNICRNKKMLVQSSFNRKFKGSVQNPVQYEQKKESGLKHPKCGKSKAMANADIWFSRYIRVKYHFQILTDGTILDKCIVSGTVKSASKMDCGHFLSRQFKAIRFYEDNCRPQNRSSNRFSGEADHFKFQDNLLKEIGQERIDHLEVLRKQSIYDTEDWYLEQAGKFRKLTNELIKELSAKKWW